MRASLILLLASFSGFYSLTAKAETIKFPEDELATESVLPVFDQPTSVKSRSVSTAKRFELGLGGGYSLNEAFFNPLSVGGEVTYHLNEESGINLFGSYYMKGASSYSNQINQQASINGRQLNLQYAPAPKYLVLANYQYTGFYGKLSLSKDYVMHIHLFGLAGLGGYEIGDKLEPTFSFGLGQKFYFGNSFALRFDLRMLIYQGPNIVGQTPPPTQSAHAEVSSSAYPKRTYYDSLLSIAAIYLIPNS